MIAKKKCNNCRYFKKSDDRNKELLGTCWTDPPLSSGYRGSKAYSTDRGCRYWEVKI